MTTAVNTPQRTWDDMTITRQELVNQTAKEVLGGGRRTRTYQSVHKLLSSTRFENPAVVLAHPSLPTLASGWPTDPGAFCVSREAKREEVPDKAECWVVTCDFTSSPDVRQPPDEEAEENPLLRPAIIDRSPVSRQRPISRDANNTLIQTTAGEPFNPPVEREEHAPAFTITKNMASWPAAMELAYQDSINDDTISIPSKGIVYGAGVGKFNGFSGRESWENNYHFWVVTMEIECDWQGWNKPIVNAGYSELVEFGAVDYLLPIILGNGERPAGPVLINTAGEADPFLDPPHLLTFKKYRELPHAALYALFGL